MPGLLDSALSLACKWHKHAPAGLGLRVTCTDLARLLFKLASSAFRDRKNVIDYVKNDVTVAHGTMNTSKCVTVDSKFKEATPECAVVSEPYCRYRSECLPFVQVPSSRCLSVPSYRCLRTGAFAQFSDFVQVSQKFSLQCSSAAPAHQASGVSVLQCLLVSRVQLTSLILKQVTPSTLQLKGHLSLAHNQMIYATAA